MIVFLPHGIIMNLYIKFDLKTSVGYAWNHWYNAIYDVRIYDDADEDEKGLCLK